MKVKRTYRLSIDSIAIVKRLAEVDHVAETQDGVVDRAIQELDRRVRDEQDARLWSQAAADQSFTNEMRLLDLGFGREDITAWETP